MNGSTKCFAACPVCRPHLWSAALVVVPDAQFCAAHKAHAVRWLFERLQITVVRNGNGVATVRDAVERIPTERRLAA